MVVWGCLRRVSKRYGAEWERAPQLPRYALRGIVSLTSPAGLSCGAPLALRNASVPVWPAEKQISDFARGDNATDAERRGIQEIEIGAKISAAIPPLRVSQGRWCSGPDDNLHLRNEPRNWVSGPPRKAVPTEAKRKTGPLYTKGSVPSSSIVIWLGRSGRVGSWRSRLRWLPYRRAFLYPNWWR